MTTSINERNIIINAINVNFYILNRKIIILKIHEDFASNIEDNEIIISNDIEVINELLNSINFAINILNNSKEKQ